MRLLFRRRATTPEPQPAGALGCHSCGVSGPLPPTRAETAAFFVEHGEGHDPWIDLHGGPLPES